MAPVPENAALKWPGSAPRSSVAVVALVLLVVCACLAVSGCARHVSLSELGASDAVVWVLLTTAENERIVGQVVSLDAGSMVVEVRHELGGNVSVRKRGDEDAVYNVTERLPGKFVRVDREDGNRLAVVHREFRAIDIDTATFHESSGERSLASIVSLLLGPVIGGALGFIL